MKKFMEMERMLATLQLFAEPNTNVSTASGAGNDLSPEMKSYYDTELLQTAGPKLVHQQFSKHQPIPQGRGKTVEWRRWSSFDKALEPLQEGVTPDGNQLNVSTISKQVSQYGDYTTISDVLELTAVDDVVMEATDKHGDAMGRTLDTVARNEMQSGTNVAYAPLLTIDADGKVTAETAVTMRAGITKDCRLTPKLVAQVAAFLRTNNAPQIDGAYICIVHPYVTYDLQRSKEWIEAHKYQDSKALFQGETGMMSGVRFVETTEARVWKGEKLTAASESIKNSANAVAISAGSSTSEVTVATLIAAGDRITKATAAAPILLNLGGVEYKCVGATAGAAGAAKIVIQQPHAAIAASAVLYPGDAGKDNAAVFGCLFLGKGACGDVNVDGANARIIIKQKGSGGSTDPLDQRSTVGWKGIYAAKILIPEYIYRVECGSELGDQIEFGGN